MRRNSMVFISMSAMADGVTSRIHFSPECQMMGRKCYINLPKSEISPQFRSIPLNFLAQDGAPGHRGEDTMYG